jgi:hypothetical protein
MIHKDTHKKGYTLHKDSIYIIYNHSNLNIEREFDMMSPLELLSHNIHRFWVKRNSSPNWTHLISVNADSDIIAAIALLNNDYIIIGKYINQ